MKKIKIGDCFEDSPYTFVIEHGCGDERLGVLTADGGGSAIGSVGFISERDILDRMSPIPTLHLPIGNSPKYGGAWFDLIRTGEKKEEYREVTTFYRERLCSDSRIGAQENGDLFVIVDQWKGLKVLHLTNGYGHSKPQLWAHIEEITIGRGNPEWGAPDRDVFIIKLGAVFHTKNLK